MSPDPVTEKQLGWMAYHMRRVIFRAMPEHWEEKELPGGYVQRADMRGNDFYEWAAATLTKEQASNIIGKWSDDKEEEAFDLLIDCGLPTRPE